jgi:hypothetical protein
MTRGAQVIRSMHRAAALSLSLVCVSGSAAAASVPPTLENLLFASRSPRQLYGRLVAWLDKYLR